MMYDGRRKYIAYKASYALISTDMLFDFLRFVALFSNGHIRCQFTEPQTNNHKLLISSTDVSSYVTSAYDVTPSGVGDKTGVDSRR